MPPKPNPTLYSVPKTFFWFFVVSVLLTASLVGIVLIDYNRPWKDYQKKFTAMKLKKAEGELEQAAKGVDAKQLEDLKKQLAAAEAGVQAHRADIRSLDQKAAGLATRVTVANTHYQTLKQYQDSYRYFFEEARLHKSADAASYGKKLKAITPKVDAAKLELEKIQQEKDGAEADKKKLLEKETSVQKDIDKLLADQTRLKRLIAKLEPSPVKDVLNAPMVDFVAPTLKVQQIVLDKLYDDYHFAKTQKVDRCTTCHQGIDQKGFEDAPQPFRTHPKIDLYLGSASPHPIESFGCTTCHGGSGHSVDFTNSAHTPRDEKQGEEWKKKYGWKEMEKWDAKMLPIQHLQAACAKCHQSTAEVPQADKLNRGRKLAETFGCLDCHKVKGNEAAWKVGPDLSHVGTKLDEAWIAKWVDNPRDFRDTTKMPRIYHLSNTSEPEDRARSEASIAAIAAYLTKNSEPVQLLTPPGPGDAASGKKLVQTIGCTGCHTVAGVSANSHGPELSGLGSKVKPEWLYTWIKDPKHLSPGTQMPSLRLSDQEAADIAAYLLTLRNEKFEQKSAPQADPKVVDELILTSLQGTKTHAEAKSELDGMTAAERLQFLGKKSIAHQGCFSCHTIKGFEEAKPIGTELSNEGRKDLHQLDFGFVHIPHTRHDWFTQKLKDTRIFDEGKDKSYYDKLRMPLFNFTDEQIDDLATWILSLNEEQIPLEMQKRLDADGLAVEKGRMLVAKLNCTGCHQIDGKPGALREIAEDIGAAPPILDGEGAKVQEKWLYGFLASPTTIRPWLKYRMPTFHFTEEELTTLIRYFNGLSKAHASLTGYDAPETTAEKLAAGKQLFDQFQCTKCHQVTSESSAMGASFLAPDLRMAKHRLKPEWIKDWIRNPEALQAGTMMPGFFPDGQSPVPDTLGGDAEKQIEAIRDYLQRFEGDGGSASVEKASSNV